MDSGLGAVRWPFSPFATALAAGALFAFCLALWKQHFGFRNRRNSAPEPVVAVNIDSEGSSNEISLSNVAITDQLIQSGRFGNTTPRFSSKLSFQGLKLRSFSWPPTDLAYQVINSSSSEVGANIFSNLFLKPDFRKASQSFRNRFLLSTVVDSSLINLHSSSKLLGGANAEFIRSIFPQFKPFVKPWVPTKSICLQSEFTFLKHKLTPCTFGLGAASGDLEIENIDDKPITRAAKYLFFGNDANACYRKRRHPFSPGVKDQSSGTTIIYPHYPENEFSIPVDVAASGTDDVHSRYIAENEFCSEKDPEGLVIKEIQSEVSRENVSNSPINFEVAYTNETVLEHSLEETDFSQACRNASDNKNVCSSRTAEKIPSPSDSPPITDVKNITIGDIDENSSFLFLRSEILDTKDQSIPPTKETAVIEDIYVDKGSTGLLFSENTSLISICPQVSVSSEIKAESGAENTPAAGTILENDQIALTFLQKNIPSLNGGSEISNINYSRTEEKEQVTDETNFFTPNPRVSETEEYQLIVAENIHFHPEKKAYFEKHFQETDSHAIHDFNFRRGSPEGRNTDSRDVPVSEAGAVKTRVAGVDDTYENSRAEPFEAEKSINSLRMSFQKRAENLDGFQEGLDKRKSVMTPQKSEELSFTLKTRQSVSARRGISPERPIRGGEKAKEEGSPAQSGCGFRVTLNRDVTEGRGGKGEATSRTRAADEREARLPSRQMDRRTGERSDRLSERSPARFYESSVTSETRIGAHGDARLSTAVLSRVNLNSPDGWSSEIDTSYRNGTDSVRTVVSSTDRFDSEKPKEVIEREYPYRPTFEEFMPIPVRSNESLDTTINELNEIAGRPLLNEEAPSRVNRLMGLLSRDEERRARAQHLSEKEEPQPDQRAKETHVASIEGEWDRILRDVLASVSELEHWEEDEQRRRCDVSSAREDAEHLRQHQSDSSPTMEEEVLSPKGETPTKVKNLRFKLDPDVFDVPSDDSFYDDDEEDAPRHGWRKQPKYRAFSTLELSDEPVRLVSVHASVVPAGHKMVARPVGIDLRVRLTEERQSKRAHVGTSPSQAKRRSPVSDRGVGWCQELSPVTENVDWRETFSAVPQENNTESKAVPNGILKTPSPKIEPLSEDSVNPFKMEGGMTNGHTVTVPEKTNGVIPWKPPAKKLLSLPRKKFEPDPEAVDRITGYKIALAKPPLPPPISHKVSTPTSTRSRAEIARKQYLDSKASLAAAKVDGSRKFQQFLVQAQNDRARIVTSVPDLGAIEKAVTEQWARERAAASPRASPARDDSLKSEDVTPSRGSTPDDAWTSYVQSCRQHLGRRSQSLSYLETDVDVPVLEDDDKCRSTTALDVQDCDDVAPPPDDSDYEQSHEDLDDSGRAKSEHELRVEKSLRSLPLPDWYKRGEKPKTGFLLGPAAKEKRGWAAAKSLASSTSSLTSCGLKRPVRSLRSSRENIPWSRGSASPDGPALSLALAKDFREPYLGWRARTPTSSGVSSSPRASPPSWGVPTTDDEANGVSFDGEDAFGRTSSEEDRREDPPSPDDTGADAVTVSMDTGDPVKLPGGEDTCDDINNMSMDTCELFDASIVPDGDEPSPQADTGDDIDNLSTDTTEDKRKDMKLKRYSYSQSIYHSEWEDEESRGDRKVCNKAEREPSPSSSDHKVIWIESSFVGSRTTTSIVVLPEDKVQQKGNNSLERPASR